ncbi:hypothetical protein CPT32_27285 [Rhizobium sophoriradicis]|nr:hypothetical protein CPT32_27285 [Rhizobium sophoriradicis]PDS72416.1 hypothetical protein CO667_33605 [Rhizobium sp. L43]
MKGCVGTSALSKTANPAENSFDRAGAQCNEHGRSRMMKSIGGGMKEAAPTENGYLRWICSLESHALHRLAYLTWVFANSMKESKP